MKRKQSNGSFWVSMVNYYCETYFTVKFKYNSIVCLTEKVKIFTLRVVSVCKYWQLKTYLLFCTTMDMGQFLYTSTIEISSEEMEELFLSQALHCDTNMNISHRLFAIFLSFLIGQKCFVSC